jgi:hypothetical protein
MRTVALTLLVAVYAMAAEPKAVEFGKLAAVPPKEWTAEKPKYTLRTHQFKLKSSDDSLADAEVIVLPQSKADPEKVFPGWRAQMIPPEGKTVDENGTVGKFTIATATVHTLDIVGTWKYRERPFDPKSKEEQRLDSRVVWAIVVVGDEATHVRLSGPKAVVDKYHAGFESWLKAIK